MFETLPIEVLLHIYSFLSPEAAVNAKANRTIDNITNSNWYWKQKLKRHFPAAFKALNKKRDVNWYEEFKKTYRTEYKKFSPITRRLFSYTKENDIEGLKSLNVKLSDAHKCDINSITMIRWARTLNNQAVLDYFYQLAVQEYTAANGLAINPNKTDRDKRNILHWAILCRQPVETIKLLILQGANVHSRMARGFTPLILTALTGCPEIAELLIQNGAKINTSCSAGATPLFHAVENNYKSVVDVLLRYNADRRITLKTANKEHTKYGVAAGDAPLHAAVKLGYLHIIKSLLAKGIIINTRNTGAGLTPLMIAALEGYPKTTKLLIKKGANINALSTFGETALFIAVKEGCGSVLDILLANHANTEIPQQVNSSFNTTLNLFAGDTPLHAAVKLGRIGFVRALLDAGANIEAPSSDSCTALMLAAQHGQVEIAELLINHGANINARSEAGATALLFAVENKDLALVNLLLQHHADTEIPLQTNSEYHDMFRIYAGDRPLHAAVKLGQIEIVSAFLAHEHTNINAQNASGATPLMLAIQTLQRNIIRLIINKNASTEIPLHTSDMPLHIAAQSGSIGITEDLINHGANINARKNNGATPLLTAVRHNSGSIVDFLLSRHPNTEIPLQNDDENLMTGDTPLHVAARLNYPSIVRSLIIKGANPEARNRLQLLPKDVAPNNAVYLDDLKILNYLNVRNALPDDYRKYSLNFFGIKIPIGCKNDKKKAAANELKNVRLFGVNKSFLKPHKEALKHGELKGIYKRLP